MQKKRVNTFNITACLADVLDMVTVCTVHRYQPLRCACAGQMFDSETCDAVAYIALLMSFKTRDVSMSIKLRSHH